MALAPGTRLGPYEISAQIGAGGMGEVCPVRDTKLGRDVALKILLMKGVPLLVFGVALGCADRVTTPAPPGSITVYELPNYQGATLDIRDDVQLASVSGPCGGSWDRCISSVRISSDDYIVQLIPRSEFSPSYLVVPSSVPDLKQVDGPCDGSFDDCATLVRVSAGPPGVGPFLERRSPPRRFHAQVLPAEASALGQSHVGTFHAWRRGNGRGVSGHRQAALP